MKRMLILPVLAVAVLVLAACEYPAEVSSPISELGATPYDERLLGKWHLIDDDEDVDHATLTVTVRKDGFLDVVGVWVDNKTDSSLIEGKEDREAGAAFAWIRWTAHASVIDEQTYFNARIVDSALFSKNAGEPPEVVEDEQLVPHPERGYWLIRAKIGEGDLLTLHVLPEPWGADAEAARQVACGEKCSFGVYSVTSEELVAAIRSVEPAELFTQHYRFARSEGAYPTQSEE